MNSRTDRDGLFKALAEAHRGTPEVELRNGFENRVMQAVAEAARGQDGLDRPGLLERMLAPLALSAGGAALVAGAFALAMIRGLEADLTRWAFENAAGLGLASGVLY